MTINISTNARNAMLDAIETELLTGGAPILKVRTGAKPANCAAADSGTVVATLNLPADPLAAASGGVKTLLGTWQDLTADAAGTIGHFRVYKADGTTCVLQGSVTSTAVGTGDMLVDNPVLEAGQQFSVTGFSLTAPNA